MSATVLRPACESCGAAATVRLKDGSLWCWSCHGSALSLGYDTDTGTPIKRRGRNG